MKAAQASKNNKLNQMVGSESRRFSQGEWLSDVKIPGNENEILFRDLETRYGSAFAQWVVDGMKRN